MHPVPIMSIRLDQEFPLPSLPIEKVKNNELSEWIIPVEAAFSMDKNSAQTYQNSLENSAPHFIQFVARKGDKVVGAATLFCIKKSRDFTISQYSLNIESKALPRRSI